MSSYKTNLPTLIILNYFLLFTYNEYGLHLFKYIWYVFILQSD